MRYGCLKNDNYLDFNFTIHFFKHTLIKIINSRTGIPCCDLYNLTRLVKASSVLTLI